MFNVQRDGEIAIIRFDNPPVNAVSFNNWKAVPAIIAGLEQEDIAVVVFTGLPHKHFCAGNDFREFADLTPEDTLEGTGAVRDAIKAVRESALIGIAALHGAAMGSGFMLSCACDIRIATADARLGLPEVKVGAFGGYRIVRDILSQGEARLLTYTGRPLSGTRAHQLGVVQELYETPQDVLNRSIGLAKEIAALLKGALRAEIKDYLNREDEQELWSAYDLERELAAKTMGTAAVMSR